MRRPNIHGHKIYLSVYVRMHTHIRTHTLTNICRHTNRHNMELLSPGVLNILIKEK